MNKTTNKIATVALEILLALNWMGLAASAFMLLLLTVGGMPPTENITIIKCLSNEISCAIWIPVCKWALAHLYATRSSSRE